MCFCLARVIVIGTRDYLKYPHLPLDCDEQIICVLHMIRRGRSVVHPGRLISAIFVCCLCNITSLVSNLSISEISMLW